MSFSVDDLQSRDEAIRFIRNRRHYPALEPSEKYELMSSYNAYAVNDIVEFRMNDSGSRRETAQITSIYRMHDSGEVHFRLEGTYRSGSGCCELYDVGPERIVAKL